MSRTKGTKYKKGACIYIFSCKTSKRNGKYKIGKSKDINVRSRPFKTDFLGEEPILEYQRFVRAEGLKHVDNMIKYLLRDRNVKEKGGIDWYYSFNLPELKETVDRVCDLAENRRVPEQTSFTKILATLGFFTLKDAICRPK